MVIRFVPLLYPYITYVTWVGIQPIMSFIL